MMDVAHHHPDPGVRENAQDWVELATPLVKAFCTDSAVDLASLAIQVYGGHGYIREHGIEQILRDSKILCLYEGTNGIQAMDLVRRKLVMHNGRLPQQFFDRVRKDVGASGNEAITAPLARALDELEQTTRWVRESFRDSPDDAAFGCTDYLRAFSLVYLGWNWLRMLRAAEHGSDAGLIARKRVTAEFFVRRMLPQVHSLCGITRTSAADMMAAAAADI
jgi:hypothetical protein